MRRVEWRGGSLVGHRIEQGYSDDPRDHTEPGYGSNQKYSVEPGHGNECWLAINRKCSYANNCKAK